MRLFILALFAFNFSVSSAMADSCSTSEVAPLLDKLFSSLGNDCRAYASLFSQDAQYFHQHDGYKSASELLKNCQSYAEFCQGNQCRFLQNGEALTVAHGKSCDLLVPYIWSEIPANHRAKENLEPHTGWEYIIVHPNHKTSVGYDIQYFAELETTYSVPFNWAKPEDTPSLVAQSTLHLLSLANSASKGECNHPIAPVLTRYFNEKSDVDLWRQQGDAVVLAAGGVCNVTVPYAAQVGYQLRTGQFVFTLQPSANDTYTIVDAVEFAQNLR